MPFTAIQNYLRRLNARIAETKLIMADVAQYPQLKQSDRENAMKTWKRQSQASSTVRPANTAVLKMMGIGVEVVNGNE